MKVRKKKLKIKKKALFILITLIIFLLAFVFISNSLNSKDNNDKKNDSKEVVEEVKKVKEYEASLFMVGDALIHSSVYIDAKNSDGTYDFRSMLSLIKPIAKKYDLSYYNQETILGGEELGYSNYPRFNSPQAVGDAFLDSGFKLVSLANNHTMDKGETGVINSVNYWKSKKNVVFTGQWTSQEERDQAKIYKINGISYAFFSYTTWTNGLETPSGKEYLNNVYSYEKASNDIAKVRNIADVIIVAMHWGIEYSLDVSKSQENIANDLSNLGVDLIIGTHPHVVEPVEYINDGRTLVIYSLGNFISDQVGIERLTGLMMEVKLKKRVEVDGTVNTSIVEPKAQLIYTYSSSRGKRNFKVYPYSKLSDDLLSGHNNYYEKYKSVVNSKYPDLVWGLTGE